MRSPQESGAEKIILRAGVSDENLRPKTSLIFYDSLTPFFLPKNQRGQQRGENDQLPVVTNVSRADVSRERILFGDGRR
jgi:hypothetical protein